MGRPADSHESGRPIRARRVGSGTVAFPTTPNMPMDVTAELVLSAIAAADELGRRVVAERGDDAYRRLHGT